MKIRDFVKTNAFKSLLVLLSIVIICGGIIAVCNGLFAVSDEEVTNRAVAKIFGKTPDEMISLSLTDAQKTNRHGSVSEAHIIVSDGETSLMIKTTGGNGYKGGTITTWVVISTASCNQTDGVFESAEATGIVKVRYESNTAQTLMSNFKDTYYTEFTKHNDIVVKGEYFTTKSGGGSGTIATEGDQLSPASGASYSSIAIVNSVNAALCFAYGGEQ